MNKKHTSSSKAFVSLVATVFVTIPTLAFAELSVASTKGGFSTIGDLVSTFTSTIVKSVGTLFMALGVVAFLYGIMQYVWGVRGGDPKKIEEGNKFMIWGLVGLFVMFSVFGIVTLAQSLIFNKNDVSIITIPDIKLSPK